MKKNYLIKRISIFLFFLLFAIGIKAQDITFNVTEYKGGYNISCHGLTDGAIDATMVGGSAPYTYSWSNGAVTQDLAGVAAGSYTLTVTDGHGDIYRKSVTLYQPDAIGAILTATDYSGFNISQNGEADGGVTTDVSGGAPPYVYLWSDATTKSNAGGLTAGTYSVSISDQNGCSVSRNITLTEPQVLQLSFTTPLHGTFNTSCNGSTDGSIDLTVSGGAAPYSYNWDNGAFTQDLTNIPAGDYNVEVTDANGVPVDGHVTLTQPNQLSVTVSKSTFANGHNTGCSDCYDGSAEVGAVSGGTHPYSYAWTGGTTGTTISNIGAGTYTVTTTDAHSCISTSTVTLSAPPSNAWTKSGNTGDTTQFMGTTNAAPMIFKTNGSERLRLTSAGNVGVGVVNPVEKLEVTGNIRATGNIMFGGNKQISFTPAGSGHPNIYSIGAPPVLTAIPSCFPTINNVFQYQGLIQVIDSVGVGTASNDLAIGLDPSGNGFIDLAASAPTSALYINQFCGKNIALNFGSLGGNIAMASTGKVGIGTNWIFHSNSPLKISLYSPLISDCHI